MNFRPLPRATARFLGALAALTFVLPVAAAERVGLKLVADGLVSPLSYVPLPDGRALVVDQTGPVHLLGRDGKSAGLAAHFTNKLSEVTYNNFDERGVLDLALHPKFSANRRVLVTYTAPKGPATPSDWNCNLRLSSFTVPAAEPFRLDLDSERVLLDVPKPFHNHNGGRIAFGPDGFLYITVGDGGAANDQGKRPTTGNGQNLWSHLGKILRLDVDQEKAGKLYAIPADNPFADGKEGLPEIYAYGLRNVWGISFDRGGARELFAADVGQNLFEEVNIIVKGGNYGWNLREAFVPFDPASASKVPSTGATTGARGEPLLDPIFDYKHPTPRKTDEPVGISITGGYVYRGKALPALSGKYVFGDWSRNMAMADGVLFAATRPTDGSKRWTLEILEVTGPAGNKIGAYITGFGEDNDGELYMLTNDSNALRGQTGKVLKIVPAN